MGVALTGPVSHSQQVNKNILETTTIYIDNKLTVYWRNGMKPTMYSQVQENFKNAGNKIGDIPILSFGDIDIRFYNIQDVKKNVESYFDCAYKKFGRDVIFLLPCPPVDENNFPEHFNIDFVIPYKERLEKHNIYKEVINNLCLKNKLLKPIDYNIVIPNLSENDYKPDGYHLKEEFNKFLFNYIVNLLT